MRPGTLTVLGCAIALFLMGGCIRRVDHAEERQATIGDRQIRAVCTTGMVADMVGAVGGERLSVKGLMGAGVDPHSYKARESDVLAIADADIVFTSGLHLEAKLGDVLERIGGGVHSVQLASVLDEDDIQEGDDPHYPDPHIWFDVGLWSKCIATVEEALIELDPAHSGAYRQRGAAYRAQLTELHNYVTRQAARIPPDQRVLVTAHDAFGYFGHAYGFEVVGLQGISTASEAGAGDVSRLAQMIADRRIRAVFIESSVPERNVRAVQEAVRARGWNVELGGELFSDAMGVPGTAEGTYTGMVRHNIDTIFSALAGEPGAHGNAHEN